MLHACVNKAHMVYLLYTASSLTSDAACAVLIGYGTYVVPNYVGVYKQNPCNNTAVLMLKLLVWSAWAMLAFNW